MTIGLDTMKVGIKLVMEGNAAGYVAALSKSLLGINAQVDRLITGSSRLKIALGGALSVFAGEKILSGMTALVEKTADLSHELTQIQKLGGGASAAAANTNAIAITNSLRGITQTQALRIYGQTYGLLGSQHALEIQGVLAKYGVALQNTKCGDRRANRQF
jgi:hypothetical protein